MLLLKACILSSEAEVLEYCEIPLEVIPLSISHSSIFVEKEWKFGFADLHFSSQPKRLQVKVEAPKCITLKDSSAKIKINLVSSPRIQCSSLRVTLCQHRPGFWNTKNLSQIIVPVPVNQTGKAVGKEPEGNTISQVIAKLPLDSQMIAPRSVPSGKIVSLGFEAEHYLKVEFLGVTGWYQPDKEMKISILFYPIQKKQATISV
jgi:hypothetical protein